ncbi:hypothetical protein CR513_50902, partial [Mucuna pruriens]
MTNPILDPGATSTPLAPLGESSALQTIMKELDKIQKQAAVDSEELSECPRTPLRGQNHGSPPAKGWMGVYLDTYDGTMDPDELLTK